MMSVEEIQKQRIGFEAYLKKLVEELTKFLNKNISTGKFFILDSRPVWHIISSKTLMGISFNILYLEEFLSKNFLEYKIVVVARKGSWKEEFQTSINKKKPYSTEDLNKAKNEIFTRTLKIAKKEFE